MTVQTVDVIENHDSYASRHSEVVTKNCVGAKT